MIKPEKLGPSKPNRKRAIALQAEYARLIVNGITVQLPPGFKPYPSQQLMFVKIIQSLKNKKHAMIESPTGSGKSLGLLSACCAWLQDYKVKRRLAKQQCPRHGNNSVVDGFVNAATDTKMSKFEAVAPSKTGKENNESSFLNYLKNEPDDLNVEDPTTYDSYGEAKDESLFDNSEHQPEAECTCGDMKKIRIYYGTRTHKQISQVIKEFSRLPYGHERNEKQLKHTILASREQSCLNPTVRESEDRTAACKELIAPDGLGCVYRHNLRTFDDPNKLRKKIDNCGAGVWDIEELSEALKTPEICAYFASTRSLTVDADIIFTPFNYLLDPIIRNSSDVILKNSIVILDEAHNVEDTCRDAVSFQFKESEFGAAFNNFNEKLALMNDNSLLTMLKKNTSESNAKCESLQEIQKYKESLQRMSELAKRIYDFFCKLAKLLDESTVNKNSRTWNWDAFVDLLKDKKDSTKNLFFENDSALYNQYLTDFNVITAQKSKDESTGDIVAELLQEFKLSSVAIVLVEKFLYFMKYFQINKEVYKCNITVTTKIQTYSNQRSTQRFTQHHKPKFRKDAARYNEEGYITGVKPSLEPIRAGCDAVLNFWCMSPSVACSEAFKECHSVILASGTLCPTETLKTELGLAFNFEMEGNQVIPDKQIFASVISKGPHNYPFKCTYKNMQDQTFYIELLRTIRDVCKTVPKGVLVFVSSYRILNDIQKFLRYESLQIDIEKHKQIFFEPNRSSDLKKILADYTFAIENVGSDVNSLNGAIMFAVFRGKVSEGIDFTDDMARCVICIGIPFPNATDELVLQKKAYNDFHSRSSKILSGDEWYSTQAYRALNQALGRCLRHRNDWGAILLIDERFIEKANPKCPDSKKISRWVRHRLIRYNDHQSLLNALSVFVNERMNDETLKPVKKEIIFDVDDESPSTSSSSYRSSFNSASSSNSNRGTFNFSNKKGKSFSTGSEAVFRV
uniref:DNA helicase n=1 Tax=Panagrolaimus sp. ES5 TaxID=591445 RepID=A0AC34FAL1_9BILA